MAFKLKSFKELATMTQQALDDTLLPLRVRAAKAKAESSLILLEEQMLKLEADINKAAANKDLQLDSIINMMDNYELLERKHKQIHKLLADLFPHEAAQDREELTKQQQV